MLNNNTNSIDIIHEDITLTIYFEKNQLHLYKEHNYINSVPTDMPLETILNEVFTFVHPEADKSSMKNELAVYLEHNGWLNHYNQTIDV